MLPALTHGKTRAHQIKCASNQRQIGIAYQLYVEDNEDSYPAQEGYAAGGGKKGNAAVEQPGLPPMGAAVEPTNRPLNRYVGALEVFRCPADRGDPYRKFKSKNCFEDYGNSYL